MHVQQSSAIGVNVLRASAHASTAARLDGIGKHVLALEALMRDTRAHLHFSKTRQRQITSQFDQLDRLLLDLRVTVSAGCDDAAILAAAEALISRCRRATLAVSGTRADVTTQAAIRLAADLAGNVRRELALPLAYVNA